MEEPLKYLEFGIRMFAALSLGGAIGLERQWQQRTMGLRTNGLVAVGSAMFIMMAEAGVTAISWERPRVTPRMHPLQQAKKFAPARGGGFLQRVPRAPCRQSIKSGNGFFPTNSTTPRSRTGRSW